MCYLYVTLYLYVLPVYFVSIMISINMLPRFCICIWIFVIACTYFISEFSLLYQEAIPSKCPRTEILPMYYKLTNGRTGYQTYKQKVHPRIIDKQSLDVHVLNIQGSDSQEMFSTIRYSLVQVSGINLQMYYNTSRYIGQYFVVYTSHKVQSMYVFTIGAKCYK